MSVTRLKLTQKELTSDPMTPDQCIFWTLAEIQDLCIDPGVSAEDKVRRIYAAANYATAYFELDGKVKYLKSKDDICKPSLHPPVSTP